MKIYFAASIRAGRDDADLYNILVSHLRKYGKILTEHIGDKNLSILGEKGLEEVFIHDRDMSWLSNSDVLVAEVTQASLGVGYEIGRITERNVWFRKLGRESEMKKILCLYRRQENKKLSAMILGNVENEVITYNDVDGAKFAIDVFMKKIKNI
jgi:hypothetical protein